MISAKRRILHWLLLLAIIAVYFVAFQLEDAPKEKVPSLAMYHASFGLIVFVLALARYVVRRTEGALPALDLELSRFEEIVDRVVRVILFAAPVLLPLLGITAKYAEGYALGAFGMEFMPGTGQKNAFLAPIGELHAPIAFLLLLAILIHFGASLRHHFIIKDRTLSRMIVGK